MPFYDAVNDTSNFVISFTHSPRRDFGVFAKGYWHAAATLAENLLARPRFPDYDAYPVVFLYRQAFELFLKGVLYKVALLSAFKGNEEIDAQIRNNHKLVPLAQNLARIFRILFPIDQSLLDFSSNMERYAFEYEQIDSDSFSYRYPIDTQGNPSTKHHQMVNLRSLHENMQTLLTGMDTIDFGMDVDTDKAQEIYEVLQDVQRILSEQE